MAVAAVYEAEEGRFCNKPPLKRFHGTTGWKALTVEQKDIVLNYWVV
jgi:hypothetical protein